MAATMAVHIAVEEDGRWRLAIGDAGTRPAEGLLPAAEAARLTSSVALTLESRGRVMVPGEDQARTRAEEAAGGLLLDALRQSPEPYGRLRELLGLAAGLGTSALVVIDAPDAAVRALPWELLAVAEGAPPLEITQAGGVFRLLPGRSAVAPRSGALTVWRWTPTPEDPACARLSGALGATAAEHGFTVRDLPAGGAPADPGGPELLEVIAHGRRDLEAVGLCLGGGGRDAGAAAARLGPLLERVEAVVLAVCGGADATPRELDNLAGRLAASGARAVVAPLQRVGVEALERFLAGFYGGLAAASGLEEAVLAGRRALRAWGHPHPQCRWANLAFFVTDLRAIGQGPLVSRRYQPEGWPRPGPDAAALLERARARAEPDGFLGLEHMLGALPETTGGGELTGWLRRVAPPRLAPFQSALAQLSPQPEVAETAPRPTPRVLAWGSRLQPDFDLAALALVIANDPEVALGLFGALPIASDDDPYATVESIPPDELPLAQGLAVLGGPEDGRRLRPRPGETVGRASGRDGPAHGLYAGTRLWDRKLSREHLRWLGPGRVALKRAVLRVRGGDEELLGPGEIEVRLGDVIALTSATRLVGVV